MGARDVGENDPVLIGRDDVVAGLVDALVARRPTALVGEPGLGKSAVVAAVGDVAPTGLAVGGGLSLLRWQAYLPLVRALGPGVVGGDATAVAARVEAALRSRALVIEDVHWADPATLEVAALLAGRVPILVTGRPGTADDDTTTIAADLGFDVVALAPLPDDSAAELVRATDAGLSRHDVHRIVADARGNPLVLTELAAGGGTSRTLERAIAARLAALPAADAAAAVLVACASEPVAAEVVGPSLPALEAAGLAVVAADGVRPAHDLVGDVVVSRADADGLRRAHATLATVARGPGHAARHHLAAGDAERAHRFALDAAEVADDARERAMHLHLAARTAPAAEADVRRLEAARALVQVWMAAEAEELLDTLRSSGSIATPERDAAVALLRADAAAARGDFETARAMVDAVPDDAVAGTDLEVELKVRRADMAAAVAVDRDRALSLAEAAVTAADRLGRRQPLAWFTLGRTLLLMGRPGWEDALRRAREAVAATEDGAALADLGDLPLSIFHQLAFGLVTDGRHEEAEVVLDDALDVAAAGGHHQWEAAFTLTRAVVYLSSGRFAAAADAAFEMARRPLPPLLREHLRVYGAAALIPLGRTEEAEEVLSAAVATIPRAALQWADAAVALAWAQLWAGRPGEAAATASAAVEDEAALYDAVVEAGVVRAWAALDGGTATEERDDGRGSAADITAGEHAHLAGATAERVGIRSLAGDDPAAAAVLLAEAADAWDGIDVFANLRCRWALGESLRRIGSEDAVSVLTGVASSAADLRVPFLLARANRSLRQAGAAEVDGRFGEQSSGVTDGPVTPREREILELVAEGLTNPAIAGRLGISRSTVAARIASAALRLGTTGRAATASAVVGGRR